MAYTKGQRVRFTSPASQVTRKPYDPRPNTGVTVEVGHQGSYFEAHKQPGYSGWHLVAINAVHGLTFYVVAHDSQFEAAS